jgi:glycosyltransferase involved in cell wall biosynthesis
VVSVKECWEADGRWYSSGGFPAQMHALETVFGPMTLVVLRGSPTHGGSSLPASADVVALRRPSGEDGRRKLSVLMRLPYYLREIRRQVGRARAVHVPPPGDIPLLGMVVALAMRKPLVVRYCGSWEATSRTTAANRLTRALMRRFAGGRNVMLATGLGHSPPAPNMRWVFATALTRSQVEAVRPDLDRAPGTPLRLVFAGRLSTEKGLENLIDAVSQSPEAQLTIIGDGPLRSALSTLAADLGCSARVAFAGQLPHAQVLERLLHADVCVLPSFSESFCKARLDAMLCGVPVITTPVGFGREIVGQDGERGWVVPAGDPAALAGLLHRIAAGEPDWPALRRRCRRFSEAFTLERWADEIRSACEQRWSASVA